MRYEKSKAARLYIEKLIDSGNYLIYETLKTAFEKVETESIAHAYVLNAYWIRQKCIDEISEELKNTKFETSQILDEALEKVWTYL